MGSVGNNTTANTSVVERMDTSKLTESQRKVMDAVYNRVEYARTHTLDEWALDSRFHVNSIEDARTVQRWGDYGFKSQQEAVESVQNAVEEYKKDYEEYYKNDVAGRHLTSASTNTLRALEKRGFIKIISVGGNFPDTVQIIESRRRK